MAALKFPSIPLTGLLRFLLRIRKFVASPYKTGREGVKDELATLDDLKKAHHQVNFANTFLQSIAEQLNDVSTKIDSQKGKIGIDEASSSTYNLVDNISKTFL